jgi:hypothetical protein
MPAQSAAGVRRGRGPLGAGHDKRQVAAMRSLHRLRQQGRGHPASELGRQQHRLHAVSRNDAMTQVWPWHQSIIYQIVSERSRQAAIALLGRAVL